MKFLRRLISGRGERTQDADKVDAAQPDSLAISGPDEAIAEEGVEDAVRAAGLEPSHQNPSGAVSAETAPADEAGAEIDDTADGARANLPAVGGFASDSEAGVAVTAAHDAMDVEPVVGGGARKQRALGKNTRPAVVGAQVSERPRTPSDETMRLDEEIKVLRGQLASRLKIQNAQLKKMLERFQR
jgi:hypothetical protein